MTTYQIPSNDFGRQWSEVGEEVLGAVRAVGQSGWYVLGKEVAAFEQELGARLGAPAVGCASGLDALEIALRALDVRPGDKVLTTPLSAFATTLAILRVGAVPVFVDVDQAGLVCLDAAEAALQQDRTIRFFIPVHLYGHALDLDRLERLVAQGVTVIEDMAQAIDAKWRGRPVGTVGRAAAVSFYPTKNLGALGDAGALLCGDPAVAARARQLRDYGQSAKYVHEVVGMNSRLDELHAAVLRRALLPRLSRWTTRRSEIAARYRAGIKHRELVIPAAGEGSESVWHLFPLLVGGAGRAHLAEHLAQCGVHTAVHYPKLISEQAALHSAPFSIVGTLAQAERFARQELSLPIHPYLTDAEVEAIIEAVGRWASP